MSEPVRRRILLIEHSPELAHLYSSVLVDEGFDVDVVVAPASPVDEVETFRPDLVVVDILPYGEERFHTLDVLREHESARMVVVVAISTDADVRVEAFTSYNVKHALQKPFDLDEFVDVVATHAESPTLHARVPGGTHSNGDLFDEVSRVFTERSRHILFRWIQRLKQESPWRERDDLDLAALLNDAPIILEALDVRLSFDDAATFYDHVPDAAERVTSHARTRHQQGIALASMIREYAILRDEIWRALHHGLPDRLDRDQFLAVERAINGTLDAVLVLTVTEYLRSGTRDAREASPEV